MPNGLDTDQDRRSVGPGLGPNCLQRLLHVADKKNSPEKFKKEQETNSLKHSDE